MQKDGHLLNSDTQVHECRAKYSAQLAPWISPLSWLVQKIEKVGDDYFLAFSFYLFKNYYQLANSYLKYQINLLCCCIDYSVLMCRDDIQL